MNQYLRNAYLCLFLAFFALYSTVQAQKAGGNPTSVNANAVFEMESTNRGMLLPRVNLSSSTAVTPLSAHVAGMVVYNLATAGDVTPGYYYNDGTKWLRLLNANLYSADGSLAANRVLTQGANNLTFTGSGQLIKYSGAANVASVFYMGRTTTDAEIGVSGGAGQGFTDAAQGDAWFKTNGGASNLLIGTAGASTLSLMTNNARRININSAGLVGIGTTTPAYTLHVNGSVAGTSAYNNLSDARYKTNVLPLTGALDKVMNLRGVTFDWNQSIDKSKKLDDQQHIGFIAQEIEKVLPQVVSTASDAMKTKSVAYSDVVPVLVEAIKEQQAIIDALRTKNASVATQLEQLRAEISSIKQSLNLPASSVATPKATEK